MEGGGGGIFCTGHPPTKKKYVSFLSQIGIRENHSGDRDSHACIQIFIEHEGQMDDTRCSRQTDVVCQIYKP